MPIKISFIPYVPPIKHPAKIVLTSQQRFERIKFKLSKNKTKLRLFHFNLIEGLNGKVVLFNGDGKEIGLFNNSLEGARIARQTALNLFLASEDQNGGFSFTSSVNYEFMSYEEIEKAKLQTSRLLDYNPFKVCKNCDFQFEPEEFLLHKCIVGATWIVFI